MVARIAMLLALLLGFVACGGDENEANPAEAGADPVAVDEAKSEGDGVRTFYDKAGRKSLEATYKGDELEGPWTAYHLSLIHI